MLLYRLTFEKETPYVAIESTLPLPVQSQIVITLPLREFCIVGVKLPVVLPKEPFAYYNVINNTVDIEVKQDKENTENMETNEKTISIPDGWEFDRIDDGGNVVLKEKKKELPNTWLKCLRSSTT